MMEAMAISTTIPLARARAHWHLRAGLAAPLSGEPDEVIARTGWVRTLGGADVYLATRARVPGLARATLDALVAASRLRVIPAVRGCIYLVPAEHAPLALAVAADAWRKRTDRELPRAGTSWEEVEEVGRAIVQALGKAPATTDGIRRAVPAGAVRSLGDRGKKVGLSSPLPVALRDLELRGVIERTLEGGRLDTERYVWRITSPDAGWSAVHVPDDALGRWAELARIFVGQAGPATTADLAAWAGLSQRDARAAIAHAGCVPVRVEHYADEAWILPEDEAALAREAEPSSRVALLSFEDGYLVAHGGPKWVVDPEHWGVPVVAWGKERASTLGEAAHIQTRTFTVGDEVAGIWEMDPDAGQVLWASFGPVSREARAAIDRLATETARFLADEIGHARSFSLDTDATVRERAAEVARIAGGAKLEKPKKVVKKKKVAKAKKVVAAVKKAVKKVKTAKKPDRARARARVRVRGK